MIISPAVRRRDYSERTVTDIDGKARSFTFHELISETEYTIYIIAYNNGGMSNRSDVLTFTTTSGIHYSHSLGLFLCKVKIACHVICIMLTTIYSFGCYMQTF